MSKLQDVLEKEVMARKALEKEVWHYCYCYMRVQNFMWRLTSESFGNKIFHHYTSYHSTILKKKRSFRKTTNKNTLWGKWRVIIVVGPNIRIVEVYRYNKTFETLKTDPQINFYNFNSLLLSLHPKKRRKKKFFLWNSTLLTNKL